MLTNDQAALLIQYYRTVELTGEQKDRLIAKYWEANEAERRDIARAYAKVFAEDGAFMQRLMAYFDLHRHTLSSGGKVNCSSGSGGDGGGAGGTGTSGGDGSALSGGTHAHGSGRAGAASPAPPLQDGGRSPTTPVGSPVGSSSGTTSGYVPSRMTHSQRLLRTAIQDKFPKLTGPGPFQLCFGLVRTEAERKEVIDLYASQFTAPDPPELHRLVTLPQTHSTRTRRKISGNYTWYLRCLSAPPPAPPHEMVCAVTVTAHHHQTHHFVEMPLFATAGGYKKNGFGRLLNAALAAWCVSADFEFIMISADVNAIPFWKHMGYELMTASEKKKIAFYYEHECYKFSGAEPMIGYCGRSRRFRGHSIASQMPMTGHAMASSPPSLAEQHEQHEQQKQHPTGTSSATPLPLCDQTVARVLQGMPRFVLVGSADLSTKD